MKKILILLAILGLGAGLFFAFKSQHIQPALNTSQEIAAMQSISPVVSIPDADFFGALGQDTVAALSISADGLKPVIDHFNSISAKAKNLSLWKKLNVDAIIDQALKEKRPNSDGSESEPTPEEVLNKISQAWQSFEHLQIAVSDIPTAAPFIPPTLVRISLHDEDGASKLFKLIDQEIKKIPPTSEVVIKQTDANTYTFNFPAPKSAPAGWTAVQAVLTANGRNISLSLQAPSADFFFKGSGPRLVESEDWKEITKGAVDRGLLLGFLRSERIATEIKNLSLPISEDETKLIKDLLDRSFSDYKSISFGLGFFDGLSSKGCVVFNPKSELLATLTKAFEGQKQHPNSDPFLKLINPRTTLALRYTLEGLEASIDTFRSTMQKQMQASADQAGFEKLDKQLESIKNILTKIDLKEIGLVINLKISSYIPDFDIFLGGGDKTTLQSLNDGINEIVQTIAPAELKSSVMASLATAPSDRIKISVEDQEKAYIGEIGPHLFAASQNDSAISDAKTSIASSKSFLSEEKLQQQHFTIPLAQSDMYAFFSSSSMLPMLQQTAPLLALGRPDLKVTDQDITEILNLLDFNLLYAQKNFLYGSQMCGEGRGVLF